MKLKEYLDKNGVKYCFFANQLGVSYPTVLKYMKHGYDASVSVINKIHHHTNGVVKYEDWLAGLKEVQEKNILKETKSKTNI